MKKTLLTLALIFLSFRIAYSKPVPESAARRVATNFYSHASGKQVTSVDLAYAEQRRGTAVYYAFNINGVQGFVLVAADDRSMPILGYSTTSAFITPKDNRVGVQNWLAKYANEINYIVYHDLKPNSAIISAWAENLDGSYPALGEKNHPAQATAVAPLLPCTWDQDPYYDDQCPYDSVAKAQTVTGCPATAMAQIMKKWGYPQVGAGNYSYNSPKYGDLSANFGGATYNWDSMPNAINAANAEIAKVMFHIGVACQMEYGTAASGGSGAYVIQSGSPLVHCCEFAFKNYFRYDSTTLRGLSRSDFNDSTWLALLKGDLDLGRPTQYSGDGPGGGHTWVCDGYDAAGLFHMNWGWGGTDNGFFTLSALSPSTLGTGGGSGNFNGNQQCLLGIQPIPTLKNVKVFTDLKLAEALTVTPNPVSFSGSFNVSTTITNSGTKDYSGYLAAQLFDKQGHFIENVQILSNQAIAAGATSGTLTFTTAGLVSVPGEYTVGVYTSTNQKDWTLVGAAGFTNPVPFAISASTDGIALTSAVTVMPKPIMQNGSMTVSAMIKNNTATTFKGVYFARLYDLDGNFVESLGQYAETAGLAAGASYPNAISFVHNTIASPPGSYTLAIAAVPDQGDTSLCGGPNPINVTIIAQPVPLDAYEPNNDTTTATPLPLTFAADNATVATTGATINIGTDNDYYKVDFPAGHSYTINAILRDINTDPTLYTVDGGVSYFIDGVESPAYDDTISTISMPHGGPLMFRVAPYNAGQIGTYQLSMEITRAAEAVGASSSATSVTVYPNPASTFLHLSANVLVHQLTSIEVRNVLGERVRFIPKNELLASKGEIDVRTLPTGYYTLILDSGEAREARSFIINR